MSVFPLPILGALSLSRKFDSELYDTIGLQFISSNDKDRTWYFQVLISYDRDFPLESFKFGWDDAPYAYVNKGGIQVALYRHYRYFRSHEYDYPKGFKGVSFLFDCPECQRQNLSIDLWGESPIIRLGTRVLMFSKPHGYRGVFLN